MKKKKVTIGFSIMVLIGVVLFIYGCTITIPSEEMSYYESKDKSQIEQYVGGDAYNYIIGAQIVGSKIVAATVERAIFICVGLFMVALGAAYIDWDNRKESVNSLPDLQTMK